MSIYIKAAQTPPSIGLLNYLVCCRGTENLEEFNVSYCDDTGEDDCDLCSQQEEHGIKGEMVRTQSFSNVSETDSSSFTSSSDLSKQSSIGSFSGRKQKVSLVGKTQEGLPPSPNSSIFNTVSSHRRIATGLKSWSKKTRGSDGEMQGGRTERIAEASSEHDVFLPPNNSFEMHDSGRAKFFDSISGMVSTITKSKAYVGNITFSLSYHESFHALRVAVAQARGLRGFQEGKAINPYVEIVLLPDKKKKFKTSTRNNSFNPVWHEEFWFQNLEAVKLRGKCVKFTVKSHCNTSQDDALGDLLVDLINYNPSTILTTTSDLGINCRSKNIRGEMKLTLLYNPVANILKVTIHEVCNLKSTDLGGKADPYCILKLQDDRRILCQHQTLKKMRTLNASFEEVFPCTVEIDRIKHYQLIIKVKDYDMLKWDDEIGRVVLTEESPSFRETFAKPGTPITQWHNLRFKNSNKF